MPRKLTSDYGVTNNNVNDIGTTYKLHTTNLNIVLTFIPTVKNAPAKEFYQKHGFIEKSENNWELKLPGELKEHFIQITRENNK